MPSFLAGIVANLPALPPKSAQVRPLLLFPRFFPSLPIKA